MNKVENLFDINHILKHSFVALKSMMKEKKLEFIFDINKTIPRELRGNDIVLEQVLTSILTFVSNNTNTHEILLTLNAPEDFLYEEDISFVITKTGITREKVLAFLETDLSHSLEVIDGKIVYDENDIHLKIPLTIGELGFRRHYRLPSKSMLEKKVLLIIKSETMTRCMHKMFTYFLYDIDEEVYPFHEDKIKLVEYDLIIMEDSLVTESFSQKIHAVQEEKNLKYVILGNEGITEHSATISTHLSRPVTQESIFELIVLLFEYDESKVKNKKVVSIAPAQESEHLDIPIPERLEIKSENNGIQEIIEQKRMQHVSVLDTRVGLENTKKQGLLYAHELQNFLESFNKSDLYFRQIVNEKQSNKIKDFCIDLEKQSKLIGAERMLKFSDTVSLIFVYDKLDMLPIYPGRYHMELAKLIGEIKKYLHIK